MSDILIQAEHVSKKFCRSLKRSLWYGIQDVAHSLNPWSRTQQETDLTTPITAQPLRKDEFWALQDINFEVRRGECLGLIGHNGAGKSTLLKILNGLIRPDHGRITMHGRVAALIELNAGFNGLLTGRENIYNQATLLGLGKQEIKRKFDSIVAFSEIEQFLDMQVQNYSSGMKVRLGFAVAAQMDPDVLIIDEVLAVGDTSFRFKCMNAMAEIMQKSAVIFVSHSMQQITRVSTSGMVMSKGRQVYYGTSVPTAIEEYYRHNTSIESKVTGSGAVSISSINANVASLSNPQHSNKLHCGPNDAVEVAFQIKADPKVTECIVQGLLWNEDLVPVAELVHYENRGIHLTFDKPYKVFNLRLTIPPIGLNGGNYFLTLSIVSPDYRQILCRHDNVCTICISNPTVSGAVLIKRCDWESQRATSLE
jgi:lipopolysaccharide transport system ATP-binding protein